MVLADSCMLLRIQGVPSTASANCANLQLESETSVDAFRRNKMNDIIVQIRVIKTLLPNDPTEITTMPIIM